MCDDGISMKRKLLGFSLIELIVVVGMMAMLIGLVIPQFVGFNRRNTLREEARVMEDGFKSAQSLAESGIQNASSTIDRYRFDLLQGTGDAEGCYRGYRTVAVDADGNATGTPLELKDLICPVVIQSDWSTLYFDRAGGQLVNPLGLTNQTFTICYPESGSAVDMSFGATGQIVTGDVSAAAGRCTCSTACGAMVEATIEEVLPPVPTPTPVPNYTVTGYVDVQGKTNDSGVTVTFTQSAGPAPAIVYPVEETILDYSIGLELAQATYSATTVSSGAFSINLPAGYYSVVADKASYIGLLALNVFVSGNTTWSVIVLKGGDANNDGAIGQADLDLIGAQYGNTCSTPGFDTRADVNGDCNVNIQDLSLAGGNFGLTEPLSWTP